ncbi:MAG: CRISPR-associated endonuclease Cas1, partial [Planctomycetes bacterium]|nr:CRISPR-associated endonuclease Cas1 [Planctomycetota bacterium]
MIPLPELVPARMLNEFAYCPRLAFLEWAEATFEHNPDTLDGRFVHRRVDAGDERAFPPPDAPDTDEPYSPSGEPAIRRLLTVRDEALPVHVVSQGAFVGKSADRITIRAKGELDKHVRLIDIAQLCLYGNVQISTQAFRELVGTGIPITFHTQHGYFLATANGLWHGNAHLRIAQHAVSADPVRSLRLAKGFITAKIRNQRVILRRNDERAAEDADRVLDRLATLIPAAMEVDSIASLLGIEGIAARLYFSRFGALLKFSNFNFESRNRRPPTDPVNALLSFTYALLTRECHIAAMNGGFDPL